MFRSHSKRPLTSLDPFVLPEMKRNWEQEVVDSGKYKNNEIRLEYESFRGREIQREYKVVS